jgi:hypothetical protein
MAEVGGAAAAAAAAAEMDGEAERDGEMGPML